MTIFFLKSSLKMPTGRLKSIFKYFGRICAFIVRHKKLVLVIFFLKTISQVDNKMKLMFD